METERVVFTDKGRGSPRRLGEASARFPSEKIGHYAADAGTQLVGCQEIPLLGGFQLECLVAGPVGPSGLGT
jgi:hypothetical protein